MWACIFACDVFETCTNGCQPSQAANSHVVCLCCCSPSALFEENSNLLLFVVYCQIYCNGINRFRFIFIINLDFLIKHIALSCVCMFLQKFVQRFTWNNLLFARCKSYRFFFSSCSHMHFCTRVFAEYKIKTHTYVHVVE